MIYSKWTELKRDSHIKLSCGCEGFVKSLHFENDPLASGFQFMYTTDQCQKRISLESVYTEGRDPVQSFFNQAMAESAMIAEDVPTPKWWKNLESNKTNPEQVLP